MSDWKSYIGGDWIRTGEMREIARGYDQSTVGAVHLCGAVQMETAISRAAESFPATRRLMSSDRRRILTEIQAGLLERRKEFAQGICDEAGKPIRDSQLEVDRAIDVFSLAAAECCRPVGDVLPLDLSAASASRFGITKRFPVGPVGAITPFNFPLNLVAHKIAPAIAAGNPIVLKPAERTPITALRLAEVIDHTDWPKGAFSVVPAKEPSLGELLATDPRIKILSFTGAASVGWRLKSMASGKRVILELGGNAAVIVHSDADLDLAASRCVAGAFAYAGQICISVQRIYAHRSVWRELTARLVEGAANLSIGDPRNESTRFVAMIDQIAARKAYDRIHAAIAQGAKPLVIGEIDGAALGPTILTNTNPSMEVVSAEVFGPVLVVEPYDDYSDALTMVNSGEWGLQAGVFTRDIGRIFDAFSTLEVGGVIANDVPTFRADSMPYGGEKQSGFGREGVRYAIEEMTEMRVLVVGENSQS